MKINIGDMINTPRFLTVKISKIFPDSRSALVEGYSEPTHFEDEEYEIFGKSIGLNRMIFAAVKK